MKMRIILFTLFIVIFLPFWGCTKEETSSYRTLDYQLKNTTKIPSEDLNLKTEIISGETIKLVYENSVTPEEKFAVGDIILGTKGEGYLKRIRKITTRGDTVVILTDNATIPDAFEKLIIDTVIKPLPSETQLDLIALTPKDTSFFDDIITEKGERKAKVHIKYATPNIKTTNDSIIRIVLPNVSINLELDSAQFSLEMDSVVITMDIQINLEINYIFPELRYFSFISDFNKNINLYGTKSTISVEAFEYSTTIWNATIPLGAIPIGPVVITLSLEIPLKTEFSVDIALVNFNLFTQTNLCEAITAGALYDGAWHSVWETILDGTADIAVSPLPPRFSLEIDPLVLEPRIATKIYGIAGPYIGIKAGTGSEFTLYPDPTIDLFIFLKGVAGMDMNFIHMGEHEITLTGGVKWKVYEWQLCETHDKTNRYIICDN